MIITDWRVGWVSFTIFWWDWGNLGFILKVFLCFSVLLIWCCLSTVIFPVLYYCFFIIDLIFLQLLYFWWQFPSYCICEQFWLRRNHLLISIWLIWSYSIIVVWLLLIAIASFSAILSTSISTSTSISFLVVVLYDSVVRVVVKVIFI